MDLVVEFTEESIGIIDGGQEPRIEYAYWIKDEWIEDPEVVFSLANAVLLAMTEPDAFIIKCNGTCQECGRNRERDEDGIYCEMCQPSPNEEGLSHATEHERTP